MRAIIIQIIFLSSLCHSVFCQIEYALVESGQLHRAIIGEYGNVFNVESFDLQQPDKDRYITILNAHFKSTYYHYPKSWDKCDSLFFAVHCIHYDALEEGKFMFSRKPKETLSLREKKVQDSLLVVELSKEFSDEELFKAIIRKKRKGPSFRNVRSVYPLVFLFRWKLSLAEAAFERRSITDKITFDFLASGKQDFTFFIRDDHQFTIWEYIYTDHGDESRETSWKETSTYSRDSTDQHIKPERPIGWYVDPELAYHPSGKQHRYEAIDDSLFFEGHFKVIAQDGEYYCINIGTGLLYHIGDQDIVRIGALDIKDYPRWIFGKRLFIEDRDAGELVFFSAVERTNTKRPFPKIVSLSSKAALYERYPGLKGK